MSRTQELPLRVHNRDARLRVTPCHDGGFLVSAALEGREFMRTHCSTWQRVERLRTRLEAGQIEGAAGWRRRRHVSAAATLLAIALAAGGLTAQPLADVTAAFDASVAEYLGMRERLRASVMPEHIIDPHIREISGALLAVRIAEARRHARPGDVFTMAMSDWIRDALHQVLDGTDVDRLLAERYPRRLPDCDTAQLNASYPGTLAVRPPAEVITVLPRVPVPVLGYRLIGRDLLLWDEDAAVVVDIVVEALPSPRIWAFLDASSWEVRARITRALGDARLDGSALLDDMRAETIEGAVPPVVGKPFSWFLGSLMPSSILNALPPLPAPLQYRFVGADLIVIDIQTNLVVGILRDAIPGGVPC